MIGLAQPRLDRVVVGEVDQARALSDDGLWTVTTAGGGGSPGDSPTALRSQQAAGWLIPDLAWILRADPHLLLQRAHVLLDTNFPPSLHQDLCAAIGLDLEEAERPATVGCPQRDPESRPNPGGAGGNNALTGVAATSGSNAWAVGDYVGGAANRTLIEHWNGHAWKQVASPSPSSSNNALTGVAATSARNAWAVGYYASRAGYQTLIEHWNGRAGRASG